MPDRLPLSHSVDCIGRHLNIVWRNFEVASCSIQLSFNKLDFLSTSQQLEQARLSDIASMMQVP